MPRHLLATLCATSVLTAVLAASAEPTFNRIASFPVHENLPDGADPTSETSAEIITASEDGETLIYSDSPAGGIGFVDISDAANPGAGGFLALSGEPTAVSAAGENVLAGVNTSESFTDPSGRLAVVSMADRTEIASCDLPGQPDSTAVSPDGSFAAVAIENERDEDLNDGRIPQLPAGTLVILPLSGGMPDCEAMRTVDVTGLAEIAPSDPEPEFVDFNTANEIVVSLQENNHLVIVDAVSGEVTNHFSAGSVDLTGIDTAEDGRLSFTDGQEGRKREPDAVKWIDEDRFVSANEGDYEGGSRGFTLWHKDGTVLYESGNAFEYALIRAGHYPESRSDAKGIEPEGLETAEFDGESLAFVLSERGSMVGVYRIGDGDPELLQLLPSGVSPEGAVAIPSRSLFVTANEADLGADGGPRAHVMIYERAEQGTDYPQILSEDQDGTPIGWGALSGLAADTEDANTLYAVSDSFYSAQPRIFTVDVSQRPARITAAMDVTLDGAPANNLDLEGITPDGEGGFWLASEGDLEDGIPHQILRVDGEGAIQETVEFPAELLEGATRFGAEGIALDGETLLIAIQRPWEDDPEGMTKILTYTPSSAEWAAVRYPLDGAERGWVGLSEITVDGDFLYLVERDNQIGENAAIKQLTRVVKSNVSPAPIDGDLPTVEKEVVHDFIPDLQALNGFVVDKIEGFTIASDGTAYAVTDNDGVDGSSGETLFFEVPLDAGQEEASAASR